MSFLLRDEPYDQAGTQLFYNKKSSQKLNFFSLELQFSLLYLLCLTLLPKAMLIFFPKHITKPLQFLQMFPMQMSVALFACLSVSLAKASTPAFGCTGQ